MKGSFCGLFSLILFCSLSYADQQAGDGSVQLLAAAPAAPIVTVVDETRQPISGASIMLGTDVGIPFPGNVLTTNAQGSATLPTSWHAILPITVQAPGYISETVPSATPGITTIQLTHQEGANQIEVAGSTDGYGTLTDDGTGTVNFSLVIPALSRAQLLSFNMADVISPQTDQISVLAKTINLPSNISLPDQYVTYIFQLELNKPAYRAYVRDPGQYVMSAVHGSFSLGQVAKDFTNGKSIFDMINSFTFIEGGQRPVTVANTNLAAQDITINTAPFNTAVTVKAPVFPSNQVMVSLGLNEDSGLLSPTDLKRLTSGQSMPIQTKAGTSSAGNGPSVLSLLMVDSNAPTPKPSEPTANDLSPVTLIDTYIHTTAHKMATKVPQSFNQLTFALLPVTGGTMAPEFLPLINPPTLDAANVLHLDTPTLPAGLSAVATYLVLSEIQTFPGTVPTEQGTRLWEVWAPTWLNQVQLPKITFTHNANRTYRWDVMFLARPINISGSTPGPNGVDLNSITHVTRNVLDI